mgnify:FL=1
MSRFQHYTVRDTASGPQSSGHATGARGRRFPYLRASSRAAAASVEASRYFTMTAHWR